MDGCSQKERDCLRESKEMKHWSSLPGAEPHPLFILWREILQAHFLHGFAVQKMPSILKGKRDWVRSFHALVIEEVKSLDSRYEPSFLILDHL
jgi:hypothetical protein